MKEWVAVARGRLVLALTLAIAAGMLAPPRGIAGVQAAQPSASQQCPPAKWYIVETANFRVLSYGTRPVSRGTAESCEALRKQLVAQWLTADSDQVWSPKCDVVLHPSDASYLREVGGQANTAASALIDRREGRIAVRRIDVRATRSDWQTTALGHELTHVVLADRFAETALPRWLDEGIAILADPGEKRNRHAHGAWQAVLRGTHFRIVELLALADYPPAGRWAAFYDQSAALVEFLVEQRGQDAFVEFVERALAEGHESALREVYDLGIGELERRWHVRLARPTLGANRPS